MQKSKFMLAVLAVVFGMLILFSSLIAYSNAAGGDPTRESEKKFYLGKKILPDHVFYPLIMLIDKGLLTISSGESEIYLRIRMAQDRMISAQKLLDKNEEMLALTTLTKSQKYLILATQQFLETKNNSVEVGIGLLKALRDNTKNLRDSEKRFKTIPTGPIGDLIIESESLITLVEHAVQ